MHMHLVLSCASFLSSFFSPRNNSSNPLLSIPLSFAVTQPARFLQITHHGLISRIFYERVPTFSLSRRFAFLRALPSPFSLLPSPDSESRGVITKGVYGLLLSCFVCFAPAPTHKRVHSSFVVSALLRLRPEWICSNVTCFINGFHRHACDGESKKQL